MKCKTFFCENKIKSLKTLKGAGGCLKFYSRPHPHLKLMEIYAEPRLGLYFLPNALDLAHFTGVFIFVRRYFSQ